MYPLSNVLGNSLNDSYGEGYHYGGIEGPYRAPLVSCEDADVPAVHIGYSEISDHYTTHDDFSVDQRGLVGIENADISRNFAVPTNPNVWDCSTCGVGKVEDGGRCTTAGCEGCRRPVKRRNTANKKERRRTQSINNAFTELRDCIPNVPSDTKLSKIKTLRLATSYIAYLSDLLSEEDPLRTPAAFTVDLSRRLTSRGGGDDKKHKDSGGHVSTSRASNSGGAMRMDGRRGKGRTGWPCTVWAMELQQ